MVKKLDKFKNMYVRIKPALSDLIIITLVYAIVTTERAPQTAGLFF